MCAQQVARSILVVCGEGGVQGTCVTSRTVLSCNTIVPNLAPCNFTPGVLTQFSFGLATVCLVFMMDEIVTEEKKVKQQNKKGKRYQ